MQLLIDYIPIVIFFAAYFVKDIYFATAVLMVAMPVILALQYLLTRKVNRMYLASTALILVLGTATLFFRNPAFVYWKPTVLNWVIALVFLGSHWIGDQPVIQRLLGKAAQLTTRQWHTLNLIWTGYFIVVGTVNIYIAYNFSEPFWVKFKLFGMLGMTIVFIAIQTIWLTVAMKKNENAE